MPFFTTPVASRSPRSSRSSNSRAEVNSPFAPWISRTGSSTGCSAEASLDAADKHELPVDPAEGGEWVAAACWHNCGGRCMNKVMVKDGAVVRQKTDDTHEDSPDYPQQRGCVRGKAQQQQCFGADRLKYRCV